MKRILVANQKGGSAKSITSYNLAYYYAEKKQKRVLFVDGDTQGNSTSSLRSHLGDLVATQFFEDQPITITPSSSNLTVARSHESLKKIERLPASMDAELVKRLNQRFSEVAQHFDVCIIDSPGSNANTVGAFMVTASHILIPTEIDSYNLQVSIETLRRVVGVQQSINKDLINLGFLPSKLKTGSANQARDYVSLIRGYGRYVLQTPIGDRMPFREAADEGVPVWRYTKRQKRDANGTPLTDTNGRPILERVSNESAAKEMIAAFDLIDSKVGV